MFKSRKTVADVMAAFTRTINDLKQVEQDAEAEAARQRQVAMNARLDAEAAEAEASKARVVSAKLTALVQADAIGADSIVAA